MATDEPTQLTKANPTYTFEEAIAYMKSKDNQPTKTEETIRWFNTKNGKEVVLGYSSLK